MVNGWKKTKMSADGKFFMYQNKKIDNAIYIKYSYIPKTWQVFDYRGEIGNTGKYNGKIFKTKTDALKFAREYMRKN